MELWNVELWNVERGKQDSQHVGREVDDGINVITKAADALSVISRDATFTAANLCWIQDSSFVLGLLMAILDIRSKNCTVYNLFFTVSWKKYEVKHYYFFTHLKYCSEHEEKYIIVKFSFGISRRA